VVELTYEASEDIAMQTIPAMDSGAFFRNTQQGGIGQE